MRRNQDAWERRGDGGAIETLQRQTLRVVMTVVVRRAGVPGAGIEAVLVERARVERRMGVCRDARDRDGECG